MAAGGHWASLPSVIIVEILSYLPANDILKSSSVSKRWRSCLFHPNLWHNVSFSFDKNGRKKSKFLGENCGRFIRETVVRFDSKNSYEVKECIALLKILSKNKNLQKLSLQPSNCHILWSEKDSKEASDQILDYVEELIKTSRKLCHLGLGCVEELASHSNSLVQQLARWQGKHLQSLHLASVKEDAEHYGIIEFDTSLLNSFHSLSKLSIDYDYLTNDLLENFADTRRTELEKLCIHIHGISPEHEIITNETWRRLKNVCPRLEVTINLTHNYHGLSSMLNIFQPSMPLANFRQYHCSTVNLTVINYISRHLKDTIRSVTIVDEMLDEEPLMYERRDVTEEYPNPDPDPFVMMAWKCSKLEELKVIGWGLSDEDIIAIARLRGESLKKLTIPRSCIFSADEDSSDEVQVHPVNDAFIEKVSKSLKRPWWPLEESDLPRCLFEVNSDIEESYMDTLLQDQSP